MTSMIPVSNPEWIAAARDCFMVEFGLPQGLATAAATALLQREMVHGRVRDPSATVWTHMDSDEPPIVDPDGEYGDEA
jgi:hypothetical protein